MQGIWDLNWTSADSDMVLEKGIWGLDWGSGAPHTYVRTAACS